jgi:hypothetical protein
MGWFSDFYDKAKSTVSGLYDTVKKTASNWLQGKYLAPGYSYCGPGNSLNEGEPVNESDAHCRQHDFDYDRFKKAKDKGQLSNNELKQLVRESDDRLINNLRQVKNRDFGSYLSEYGIRAKTWAEDMGLLSPDKFVT